MKHWLTITSKESIKYTNGKSKVSMVPYITIHYNHGAVINYRVSNVKSPHLCLTGWYPKKLHTISQAELSAKLGQGCGLIYPSTT